MSATRPAPIPMTPSAASGIHRSRSEIDRTAGVEQHHRGTHVLAGGRALGAIQREFGASVRFTARQNLVFRDLTEDQLRVLYERLDAIGMAQPGAELVRDVVSCPGADTCNLAVTQSRGLAKAIGEAKDRVAWCQRCFNPVSYTHLTLPTSDLV